MPGLPPGGGAATGGLTIEEIRALLPGGPIGDPLGANTSLLASSFREVSVVHLERHWRANADRYPGYVWKQGSQIAADDLGQVGNLGSQGQFAVVPLAKDLVDIAGNPNDEDTPGVQVGDILEAKKDSSNFAFWMVTAIALSQGVRYYSYDAFHTAGAIALDDDVELLRYKRGAGFVPVRGDAADALIKTSTGYAWVNVTATLADILAGTSAAKYATPLALDRAWGWMVAEAEAAWSDWSAQVDHTSLADIGGRDDVTVSNAGVPAGNVALYRTSAWADAPALDGDTYLSALDVAIGASRYCLAYFQATGSVFYVREGNAWTDLSDDDPAVRTHWLDAIRARGAWRLHPHDVGFDWGENLPPTWGFLDDDYIYRLDGDEVVILAPVYSTALSRYEMRSASRERRPWRPRIAPKAADYQIAAADERDVILLSDADATLPEITGAVGAGWSVWIANADADAATVSAGTGQTVDGGASAQLAGGKAALFVVTTAAGYAVLCRS